MSEMPAPIFNVRYNAASERLKAEKMKQRPSVQYKPKLRKDGDRWCALYGDNIQEGCVGFGDTPQEAMSNFNDNWKEE